MTVLVLTAVPPGLRGVLTRWLFEIAPGVFVGRVSARIRDLLWERVVEGIGRGRAIMVQSQRNEQGLGFRVHGHDWQPVDFEGINLMLRPAESGPTRKGQRSSTPNPYPSGREQRSVHGAPRGWSYAERRLRPKIAPPTNESTECNRSRLGPQ